MYAGTYHTNSQIGGVIIAGGAAGAEQYDPICDVPYPAFAGQTYPGAVPAGYTANGATTWGCGQRFNWDLSSPPLTFAQLLIEAPNANCDQVGDSASYYPDITASYITWNKVVIPVEACDPSIVYATATTSDSADDSPWTNVWATTRCQDGDVTVTPGDDDDTPPPCSIDSISCPAGSIVNADAYCGAEAVDVTAGVTHTTSGDCGTLTTVSQDIVDFSLGTTTVTATVSTGGGATTATCQTTVTVVDATAPSQEGGPVSHCIWPPNHKYKCYDASLIVAHDNCDGAVNVAFASCTSTQPEDSTGDGSTTADCYFNSDTNHICYRGERQGGEKSGRSYNSYFTLIDAAGNVGTAQHVVFVPHDANAFDVSQCDAPDVKESKGGKRLRG